MLTSFNLIYKDHVVLIDLTKTGVDVVTPSGLRKAWIEALTIEQCNGDISVFVPDLATWVLHYRIQHKSILLDPFMNEAGLIGRGEDCSITLDVLNEWITALKNGDISEEAAEGWMNEMGVTPFSDAEDCYIGEYYTVEDFIEHLLEEEVGLYRMPAWLVYDPEASWDNVSDSYFTSGVDYFRRR